jgi:glycosyltransferase involved in cell wall biosynthesis
MSHGPSLEGGAAARCGLALLDGLVGLGLDCTVLHPVLPSSPSDDGLATRGFSVETVTYEAPTRMRLRWDRFAHPMGSLVRGPFLARLGELARAADVAHFVEIEAGMAIGAVECPALVQLHCLTRRDPRVWNPLRPAGRISIELLRGERSVRRRSRWLLANSAEVGDALAKASPHAQVAVAPLALDPAHYMPKASLDSSAVGLIGTARWPPTKVAVERLIERVWPLVLTRLPQARLLLAGQGMDRETFAHLPDLPGVEWRGEVPSATGFLHELGAMLYPLTTGSGAKVKVLEALAIGIPVVTTPEGAEGIGGDRGGITVQTDDLALVDAIVGLCEDRRRRQAAGAAAHETFTSHHTPLGAAKPVVELYERMLAR